MTSTQQTDATAAPAPLVAVEGIRKHFAVGSPLAAAMRRKSVVVKAIDGVSFTLNKSESVGLLGESGCGKTTMGRMLLKLDEPTEGRILFENDDLATMQGPELRAYRLAPR